MLRVAIVGRPNVGKSTLFNRLCRNRKAIVGDEPGITRDRLYGTVEWLGRTIEVLDTGGLMPGVRDVIPAKILEQVETAIRESDLLLMVVDGRAGATPLDEQLLPMLRRSGRPIWVVVNKVDSLVQEHDTAPFYAFGAEEVFPVSAEHNRGVADLLDRVATLAGDPGPSQAAGVAAEEPSEIAVAVVGRPNVGKSSLVNRLLGIERAIVSEIPGTTRDAVDTLLVRDGSALPHHRYCRDPAKRKDRGADGEDQRHHGAKEPRVRGCRPAAARCGRRGDKAGCRPSADMPRSRVVR